MQDDAPEFRSLKSSSGGSSSSSRGSSYSSGDTYSNSYYDGSNDTSSYNGINETSSYNYDGEGTGSSSYYYDGEGTGSSSYYSYGISDTAMDLFGDDANGLTTTMGAMTVGIAAILM